jgi:hypothetical protein
VQPTIEAELAGARRLLAPWAADDHLPPEAIGDLKAVVRILQRLEGAWSRVLPYLVADNVRTAELLRELAPLSPPDLRAEIDAAVSGQEPAPDPAVLDVAAANHRNEQLRHLLARAVSVPPSGEADGTGPARARVVAGLRQSLETRPW